MLIVKWTQLCVYLLPLYTTFWSQRQWLYLASMLETTLKLLIVV